MQGFADGNVVIIGHDGEKKILPSNQEEKEKDLGSTSSIGNGPGVPEGIGHGFGDSSGDGAQAKEGEVEEEEVHGGVEAVVAGYGGDDEDAAQKGRQREMGKMLESCPKALLELWLQRRYLKGVSKEDAGSLFSREDKGQWVQVAPGEVSCRHKKDIFLETIIQWDNFLWDVVESPSLEDFKM
ncbi:LOW QUALITY PROTEIN: hypothetical protein QYF61_013864 [Mycteria americana]|uniref:Uncharacterized protein n=1 Tax=Mycteria americana TaxID=33587 RepID=A0AAN7MJ32_MYCAM|nr:LOW QUALITY PROTEIN: hypothetical protein QYF61_013864 [Mycteria americana]